MNYYPKFHKRILNSLENDLLLKKSLQNIFPKLFENLDEKIAFVDDIFAKKLIMILLYQKIIGQNLMYVIELERGINMF